MLAEIATSLVMAYEYYVKRPGKPAIFPQRPVEAQQYLAGQFCSDSVLILVSDGKAYSYTRLNVLKLLRGSLVHVDDKALTLKEAALRDFIFEDAAIVTMEFAVTHTWIITPGLYRPGGNTDSHNPFLERWAIEDREPQTVTIIESIVLNIAAEYWFISTQGEYINAGRVLWDVSRDELVERFGEDIGQRAFQTILWHKSLSPARAAAKLMAKLPASPLLDR